MTEYFPEKKNILTQPLGSRGSFMAGTGAKKVIISCTGAQKRKKCGIQKEGFLYSLRNVSA